MESDVGFEKGTQFTMLDLSGKQLALKTIKQTSNEMIIELKNPTNQILFLSINGETNRSYKLIQVVNE